jgi:hypothetical protein
VTSLKWKLVSVRLKMVLIFTQENCTVCAERTIGSEIILDAADGTPRRRGSTKLVLVCLEIVLILTLDWCTVCVERTIGLKIVLDTPDGPPS